MTDFSLGTITTHIIAWHGWGFDASFWDPLQNLFRDRGGWFESADRGYFGKRTHPEFPQRSVARKVIFTHSYGLHWCPESLLKEVGHLVIFSGFLDFHPSGREARRRSVRVLRQMLNQFGTSPETVLKEFRKNCFYPSGNSYELPKFMDFDLLLDDLHSINSIAPGMERLTGPDKITILVGSDDRIVPPGISKELYNKLPGKDKEFFEIPNAGHSFPVSHAGECYEILNSTC